MRGVAPLVVGARRAAEEVDVPGEVGLEPVVLLDAVLQVVAVAGHVVRHIHRDGRVRGAVDGDAPGVRAVDRAVAQVDLGRAHLPRVGVIASA